VCCHYVNFLHLHSHPTSAQGSVNRSLTIRIAAYDDFGVDGLVGTLVSASFLFKSTLRTLQKILTSIDFLLHNKDISYVDDTPVIGKVVKCRR